MRITRTDIILLAMLAEKPSYGWEIDLDLNAIGAHLWAEYSRPHLYYALRKLEKYGYLELLPPKPHELKRLYQITSKGRQVLADKKTTAQLHYNHTFFDFDLLLGLSQQLRGGKKDFKGLIEERRSALQLDLDNIQQLWQQAELSGQISFGRRVVMRHRIKFLKSELDFLKWLEKNAPEGWDSLAK